MFHLSIFVKIGLCLILNICLWFGKNQKENKMKDKNKERITISGRDGFVDLLNEEIKQLQKKPERITIEISAELKKKVVVYCA